MDNAEAPSAMRFSPTLLRRRRRELEMSQKELAERVGRVRQTVICWESKDPDRQTPPPSPVIPLIAAALKVGVDDLYEEIPGGR